jgi:UrcA family protein
MRKLLIGAAAGVLVSALVSSTAVAQKTEEITVEASRIVTKEVARTPTGITINSMSLSYRVSPVGLDLVSSAGAADFEKRVRDAAHAACKEISRQYPDATPSDAECAKVTADKAMVKVHELVAAAGKKPAK